MGCSCSGKEEEEKLHIAMFPWLAFGHMIPYLELAKLIAQKGHKISFISTPRNIDRLPKLPQTLTPLIHFVKIPLPHFPNLPKNAESTNDLPPKTVPLLKKAFDLLQQPMSDFLRSSRPDWIVFDFASYWLPEISRTVGVRNAFFSIFNASCLTFLGAEIPDYRTKPEDFTVAPKWVPFPSSVCYQMFEAKLGFVELTGDGDNFSVVFRVAKTMRGCDAVVVRSCYQIENKMLKLLENILQKPVIPIGQLPPSPVGGEVETDTWQEIKKWLDRKPEKSTVYVAFGSEAKPSRDDIAEIALGLELSRLPFVWVLRQVGDSDDLPTGFEERVGERGLVCRRWVPQVKILGHGSVGVFLSHSGWSSVVESLKFGVPLVLLSCSNDQGLNAKLLEEKMMGCPVPRDEFDGRFTGEAVAETLRMVGGSDEGKVFRDTAKEMTHIFGDAKLQDKYVDEFLGFLKGYGKDENEIQ